MGDLIGPVFGKRFCGWCTSKDVTWWEHFSGQDKYISEITWWQKVLWKVTDFWTTRLPIWRIGRFFHDRLHVPYDDPVKVKDRWCATVKVGDVVCDCRGLHVTVAEILDKDSIVDSDGVHHDLFHCCNAVEPDGGCHTAWQSVNEMYEDDDEVS